jgi:hypothetical protein
MPTVSVPLYTQHMQACGQVRAAITAMKAMLDQADTRTNLITLNAVTQNLIVAPYPINLVGRVETLSESIQALEKTLADVENAIRGTLLYPVQ